MAKLSQFSFSEQLPPLQDYTMIYVDTL